MKKIYLTLTLFVMLRNVYSQTNENYQYVDDLPSPTVLPATKLPEFKIENIESQFKSTLPQYTRVKEKRPLSETETLDKIADKLNNTPTNANYTSNPLAPIEVPIDISEYNDVELSLADIQSGQLKEIVANKRREKLTNEIKDVANSPIGKITISLFQFCLYIVCISVLIAVVIILTGVGKKGN